ncbi:MAG: NAD-dependent epimerase/dehydratase family protein [Polyangia bacterium]
MSRVLVTGGTGFLGLEVVRQLVARGDDVRVLSRSNAPQLDALGVTLIAGDVVRDGDVPDATPVGTTRRAAALRPSLDSAFEGCDAVLHLAGFVSRDPDDSQRMMRLHVDGTRRVLTAAARANVRRVVVASTSGTIAVSRDPDRILDERAPYPIQLVGEWPYYLSKIYEEKLALSLGRELGLEVVIVNPSLLLGPGDARQSSTGDIRRYLDGELPVVPSGGLSFIDVRDAATATINAIGARAYERYLLGGPNWTFEELFGRTGRVARDKHVQVRLPAGIQTRAASLWDRVVRATGRKPRLDRVSVEMGQLYWYCDASKAKRELGLEIRDPQETLADTIRDLRARSL